MLVAIAPLIVEVADHKANHKKPMMNRAVMTTAKV